MLHRTSGSCEMRTHLHSFSHSGSEAQKNSPIGGRSCGKPNAINHPQVCQKWVVTPPVNIRCGKSITVFHIFLYVYPRRPLQKIGVVLAMAHGHLPSHPALRGLQAWPTCLGHWEISAATARHIVHPDPMSQGVEPHTPIPFPWKNQVSKIHKKYVFVLIVFSMGEAVTHCYKEISSSRMPRPHYP